MLVKAFVGESQYNSDGPVPVLSVIVSKARLDGFGSNVGQGKCPCPWQGWKEMGLKVPSHCTEAQMFSDGGCSSGVYTGPVCP